MSRTASRMLSAMKGSVGKGDGDRVSNNPRYRDNYSTINWDKPIKTNDKESKHQDLKSKTCQGYSTA